MMTTLKAAEMAGALPGADVRDHFGSDGFFVNQIFATVWHDQNAVNLNLNVDEQRRFLLVDGESFTQLDNAWGRKGWTRVDLEFVDTKQFEDALQCAWAHSAKEPKRRVRKKKTRIRKTNTVKKAKKEV